MLVASKVCAWAVVPFISTFVVLAEAVPEVGIVAELARQVPAAVSVIVVTALFLKEKRDGDKTRAQERLADEQSRIAERALMVKLVEESQDGIKTIVDKLIAVADTAQNRIEDLARDTQKKNQEMGDACHAQQRDAAGRFSMLVDQVTKALDNAANKQADATVASRLLDETLRAVKEKLNGK